MSNHRVLKAQAQRKVQSYPKNEQGKNSHCQSMAGTDPEMSACASSQRHTLLEQDCTLHLSLDHWAGQEELCPHMQPLKVFPSNMPFHRCLRYYSQKQDNRFFSNVFLSDNSIS